MRAPVEAVPPVVSFEPLQSPRAVHDEGLFVTVQLRFELAPAFIEMGLEVSVTTGFCGLATVSMTLFAEPVPPAFVQLRLYGYVPALMIPVLTAPLLPRDPFQLPLAVQLVGLFVADHEMVAD